MQMRQRDEEKRSKAWVAVMVASTIIILLVIAFFIINSMVRNPIEGEWVSEEKGYYLDIDDDGEMKVEATFDGEPVEVELHYRIDKKGKVIIIKSNPVSYAEAADETNDELTANEIDEFMSEFTTSYTYSLEGDMLILTERESAEVFKFTRIKK